MKIHKSQIPKGALVNGKPDKNGWFEGEYLFAEGDGAAIFVTETGIVFKTSKPSVVAMTALGFRAFVLFEGTIKNGEQTYVASRSWFSFKGDEK